jgi:hypothetical protein
MQKLQKTNPPRRIAHLFDAMSSIIVNQRWGQGLKPVARLQPRQAFRDAALASWMHAKNHRT